VIKAAVVYPVERKANWSENERVEKGLESWVVEV